MSRPSFTDGLLAAQKMANKASHEAHDRGQHEASNALADLSTDLLLLREEYERDEAELAAQIAKERNR